MKKRFILSAVLSCVISISTISFSCIRNIKTKKDQEVLANSNKTPEQYEKWVDSWQKPQHVYIHYNRGDENNYNDYCLWLWQHAPKDLEGSLWAFSGNTHIGQTTLIPSSDHWMTSFEVGNTGEDLYVDEYGAIVDIDLSKELKGGKSGKPTSLKSATNLGFLFVKKTSMSGQTNWISDGGKETYITDYSDSSNWDNGYETGSLHIYIATGNLENYQYSVTGKVVPPRQNPVTNDETGNFRSNFESIEDTYSLSKTSSEFTSLGVGYQIFVPSFRDSNDDGMGDIRGIIQALPYLKDLGVEVLWLTPIQLSGSYHGYDISDYYKIDPKFGTLDDYRELIYKAHKNGMKILMDLVLNHTSKSNIWFSKSQWAVNSGIPGADFDLSGISWRDVYSWKYETDKILKYIDGSYRQITVKEDAESDNPSWYKDGESRYYYYGKFGSGMPEINFENKSTRTLIKDMAKYWLSFGLDGFRLDAVKHIYMKDEVVDSSKDIIISDIGSKTAFDDEKGRDITKNFDYSSDLTKNVSWWKEFANDLKNVYPHCFLVGENFDGWGTRIAPYYQALDSQFSFSLYYHNAAKLFAQNNSTPSFMNGREIENGQAFSSKGEIELKGKNSSIFIPGGQRKDYIDGAFTSNHDVPRAINQINPKSATIEETVANDNITGTNKEIQRAKMHAAYTILNEGISWIYYGDELGMSGNTNSHIAKYENENSMDIWYRQPFLWNDKGQTSYQAGKYVIELDEYNKTLEKVSIDNEKVSTNNQMYNWYKDLISIKKMYPKNGKMTYEGGDSTALFTISGNGKTIKIYINPDCPGTNKSQSYLINPGNDFELVKSINVASPTVGMNFTNCPNGILVYRQK